MSARLFAALLGLSAIAAAAACQSSGPYSTVPNAAIGTGLAVGAAAINRAATHECWAMCRPGTICDRTSGLCVEPGHRGGVVPPDPPPDRKPLVLTESAYPSGHEYSVPPMSTADAGCAPTSSSADAGSLACEHGEAPSL